MCWPYHSILAPNCFGASRSIVFSRFRYQPFGCGFIVPGASHRRVTTTVCPGRILLVKQQVSWQLVLLRQTLGRLHVAHLPRYQALSANRLSHIIWILRKFADSWNGSGEAENAPLLTKQIDTFSTVELLFNISNLQLEACQCAWQAQRLVRSYLLHGLNQQT